MDQIAFLEFKEKIYWSSYTPKAHEPFSATVRLVQGIYEEFSSMARAMLRQRIYANYRISDMDRAMVRIAAKRISECVEIADPRINPDAHEIKYRPASSVHSLSETPITERAQMEQVLKTLEKNCRRADVKFLSDRPVAAVLLNSRLEPMAASWNSSRENRTQHAEVRTLQQYWLIEQKPVPRGAILVCSLRPCGMCAGMIWHLCEDPFSVRVIYLQDDPGPAARGTILNKGVSAEQSGILGAQPVEMSMDRAQAVGFL